MRCAISMRMMRVTYPSGDEEFRSALSNDWGRFFAFFPAVSLVPVLNVGSGVGACLEALGISGVILSGGEDIGLFPRRDETEYAMLSYARENSLPVLGVCRGAQLLNRHFGGADDPISGHVATYHDVRFRADLAPLDKAPVAVNSYHHRAITALGENLQPLAICPDGTVEAFRHEHLPIWGVMWHPEREAALTLHDRLILSEFLGAF